MAKYTKKKFINEVITNGEVNLVDGWVYKCLPVTTENFNLNEMFLKQLESEGKYENYAGIIVNIHAKTPYRMEATLPIYGRSDKYETKWLYENLEVAITCDLNDRGRKILKRANEFAGE